MAIRVVLPAHLRTLSGAGSEVPLDVDGPATIRAVLDEGFWAGMTLYPESKCTAARAIDMIETYGGERLWMNSACDWGVSVPLAVPYAALEMKRRGHAPEVIDRMVYQNPMRFLGQSPKFKLPKA